MNYSWGVSICYNNYYKGELVFVDMGRNDGLELSGSLELVYDSMDSERLERITRFLDVLSLKVIDNGSLGSGVLRVGIYGRNDSAFCLTPDEKRVSYERIGELNHEGYEVIFGPVGRDELVDELFVGFRKDPYTGIFLRTHPVEARENFARDDSRVLTAEDLRV